MDIDEYVHLEPGQSYNPPMGRLNRFKMHWRQGREDHFPICCILRFSIVDAFRDGKIISIDKLPAVKRGGFYRGPVEDDDVFVPCNIFHFSNHKCVGYECMEHGLDK